MTQYHVDISEILCDQKVTRGGKNSMTRGELSQNSILLTCQEFYAIYE